MSDKPLSPQTITDVPFPGQAVATPSAQSGTQQIYSPQSITDNPFPDNQPATHVIGDTFNTQTRRILADFQFGVSGALQIGNYKNGVSGDIRISPNGILGRDKDGNTTFAIDGTTGNAIFRGSIAAGSLISGNLSLGGNSNGNGILKLYDGSNNEIVELNNGGIGIYGNNKGLVFYSGGSDYGAIWYDGSKFLVASDHGKDLELYGDHDVRILVNTGTFYIQGRSFEIGNDTTIQETGGAVLITSGGASKTAIVPTTKGYRSLYSVEAPEVWFFDFAKDKASIDPLFLEVTEGDMKTLKTEEGELLVFRRRKGHAHKRFTPKTSTQFRRNERFLSMAK